MKPYIYIRDGYSNSAGITLSSYIRQEKDKEAQEFDKQIVQLRSECALMAGDAEIILLAI